MRSCIFLLSFIAYSISLYSNECEKITRSYADVRFKEVFDVVLDSDCSNISKDIESICRCIDTENKIKLNTVVSYTNTDDPFSYEWFHETLLECAIRIKKNKFIEPLIKHGANATKLETWAVSAYNPIKKTTTPLHYAIHCKNFSAALDLVKHHNANVSIKDYKARTPLFALCNTQHEKNAESEQLLKELLNRVIPSALHTLDPLYVDVNGFTCIDAAVQNLNCYMLSQLINHGAVPDATQHSTLCQIGGRCYNIDLVPLATIKLLRAGANPYLIDREYKKSYFKSFHDLCKEIYHTWRSNLKLSHRMFKQNAYAGTLQWNQNESNKRENQVEDQTKDTIEKWVDLPFLPMKIINEILDYAVPWSKQICNELRKKRTIKRFIKQTTR